MGMELFLELVWKSSLCAGLTLLLLRAMRGRSAAEKSMAAHFGLVTVLLLPLGTLLLPRVELAAPTAIADTLAMFPSESQQLGEAIALPAAAETLAAIDWSGLMAVAYLLPAAGLLLFTLAGLFHLGRIRDRAQLVMDSRWLEALAGAQKRLNSDQSAELLASGELKSPVSWGLLRPVIIVDAEGAKDAASAEAIIAHELAHLSRLDWLNLLIARLTTALYWFNPLVWVLARTAGELAEQAADDVVLRSDIGRADYAELLISAARHANGGSLRHANGIAPEARALGRRVIGILDPKRSRVPARLGWSAACLSGALGVGTSLAAVQPTVSAAAEELAAIGTRQVEAIAPPVLVKTIEALRQDKPAVAPVADLVVVARREAPAAKPVAEKTVAAVSAEAKTVAKPVVPPIVDAPVAPKVAAVTLAPPAPQLPQPEPAPAPPEPRVVEASAPVQKPATITLEGTPDDHPDWQRVTCRRYAITGSRTQFERICMTQQEWFKREGRIRDDWRGNTSARRS
ncbi:MAG: M56 family metallopeptidase [Allosphingosinicella sp.]|uniref:M56 family metallopeptidase n=1 Tax=Allosphingosinicella sp. TaxID=2823234 RepID=UPI0039246504